MLLFRAQANEKLTPHFVLESQISELTEEEMPVVY
ncbi:MAG: hypothetical protein ACI914_000806 [Candidatus Marivariicella framensis]|jgi:hypothetical protein